MTTVQPAHEQIVANARSIVERLRANAPESDRLGHLTDDSFTALRDAGLLQIMTPRRCGGYEGSVSTVLEATATVAEGCPGAAWVVMIANGNSWAHGRLDEQRQDEMFGAHPGDLVAGAIVPNGTARATEGGWLVSGRFSFISGIHHAAWFYFLTFADDGSGSPTLMAMYCPASDVKPLDNWDTLGMRSSGSPDVVLEDVFVPDHRAWIPGDRNAITSAALRQETRLYTVPIVTALPLLVAGSVLGAARRAQELYVARLRERTERYTDRSKAQSQAQLIRIAQTAAMIRSAELMLKEAAATIDGWIESGAQPTLEERAAVKWQSVYAADVLRKAVTVLYDAAGGGVIYLENEFLSTFRNVHVGTHHAVCDVDPAAEMYGRGCVGIEVDARAV